MHLPTFFSLYCPIFEELCACPLLTPVGLQDPATKPIVPLEVLNIEVGGKQIYRHTDGESLTRRSLVGHKVEDLLLASCPGALSVVLLDGSHRPTCSPVFLCVLVGFSLILIGDCRSCRELLLNISTTAMGPSLISNQTQLPLICDLSLVNQVELEFHVGSRWLRHLYLYSSRKFCRGRSLGPWALEAFQGGHDVDTVNVSCDVRRNSSSCFLHILFAESSLRFQLTLSNVSVSLFCSLVILFAVSKNLKASRLRPGKASRRGSVAGTDKSRLNAEDGR